MGNNMPEALQRAFEFERHGARFYLELAAATQNRLARRLLNSLAKDEVQHVMDIDEIYQSLKDGYELPKSMDRDSQKTLEDNIKTFFQHLDKETLRDDLTDVETLKLAMETERRGYRMYHEAMNSTEDENLKKFFKLLRDEEKEHLVALENVYYYLTNPSDWFAQTESQVWNWMNS
ncbi:MAG TPA: ferritin family protein [Firmicutes bacterium]|nr:ferritin family protein [Bacillota bacterium]